MKSCNLETLSFTYFDKFPSIANSHFKQFAISLEGLVSIDFSHSMISNSQLALVLSAAKNIKSLTLFHCEEISEKGLLPLIEEKHNEMKKNRITFLNLGSTSIPMETIKKIVARAPLLEIFKLTCYFKGVSEKRDTQKHFNELCLHLSTCQFLHTIHLSENDYVKDDNLISLFIGQSASNAKSKAKAPILISPRTSVSPITKLYLFNVETVTDKFLKFLSTDERTIMLRYLDLAQTWKPTPKHIVSLLAHCRLLCVQMSSQNIIGKKPALAENDKHRLVITYKDLHQF